MKNVLIYYKNDSKAQTLANDIQDFLNKQGLKTDFLKPDDTVVNERQVDLVVVVGGDGTFLGAVRAINNIVSKDKKLPPILGVHSGSLGFLTESSATGWSEVIKKGLEQGFSIEERSMLGVHFGDTNQEFSALNDVVISRNSVARMIDFDIFYNGEFVSNIRADGTIISTPTGSTAYSLASGGPILHPVITGLVITPVSPHTLSNRPIVVPDNGLIEIKVNTVTDDIIVTVDGQKAICCPPSHTVMVRKYFRTLQLVRPYDLTYFNILRNKLAFGKRG
jgi:NAD+ kinase